MIEIIGTEGSSEYRAALMVRDALEASWPGVSNTPAEQDDIKIAVSVKITGYKVTGYRRRLGWPVVATPAFPPSKGDPRTHRQSPQ